MIPIQTDREANLLLFHTVPVEIGKKVGYVIFLGNIGSIARFGFHSGSE